MQRRQSGWHRNDVVGNGLPHLIMLISLPIISAAIGVYPALLETLMSGEYFTCSRISMMAVFSLITP